MVRPLANPQVRLRWRAISRNESILPLLLFYKACIFNSKGIIL